MFFLDLTGTAPSLVYFVESPVDVFSGQHAHLIKKAMQQ